MSTHEVEVRHDWSQTEVMDLFELPFNELLFRAHQVHRLYFNPREVQISTLLSIKTGACPEDCKYCPQSVRYDTGLEPETVMDVDAVMEAAQAAKNGGASRWVQRGEGPRTRIWTRSLKWSRASSL